MLEESCFPPYQLQTSCHVCVEPDSPPVGFKSWYLTSPSEEQTCWGLAGFLRGSMVPVCNKTGCDGLRDHRPASYLLEDGEYLPKEKST